MMVEKKYYLSKNGLKKISQELDSLRKERVSKIETDAPKSLHFGDIDPEFLAFREELELLEKRTAELEEIMKNYELISLPPKEKTNIVYVGATVIVEVDKEKDEFIITGSLEADPMGGKISNECPVGKALVGRRSGEKVTINNGGVEVEYKIVKVKYEGID